MPDQRFLFVDGLRGLAALSVALFHIGRDFLQLDFLFYLGHGVTVFFVLSGFVICHSLNDKRITAKLFALFTLKRSIRLDPAYWVAIALAIAVLWLPALLFGYEVSLPSPGNIGLHMFYLQEFADTERINVVFWTLCYEIQFYLVFCALLGLSQVSGRVNQSMRYVIFSILLLLALLWPLGILEQLIGGLFIDLWYLFLMGVFARWAHQNNFALVSLLVSVLLLLVFSDYQAESAEISLVGVATATILCAAIKMGKMSDWLKWRWVQYLGMISYSLYLLHDMVGLYIRNTGLHLTGKYLQEPSLVINYFWCAVALAVSIIAAHFLYKFVEAPSHNFSRRLTMEEVAGALRNLKKLRSPG